MKGNNFKVLLISSNCFLNWLEFSKVKSIMTINKIKNLAQSYTAILNKRPLLTKVVSTFMIFSAGDYTC